MQVIRKTLTKTESGKTTEHSVSQRSVANNEDKTTDNCEPSEGTADINRHELLPYPNPLALQDLQDLTNDQKMGNIISVMNILCNKMIEIDMALHHDSDGIDTLFCAKHK